MAIEKTIFLKDLNETNSFGKKLSALLKLGDLIYLSGDLGSGKTTCVRAMLQGLGFEGKVKSPTYSLFEQYEFDFTVNHFDLYRFKSPQEWEDAGFSEFINTDDVTIIEWPEMAKGILPEPDLLLNFFHHDDLSRNMTISSLSKRGDECLQYLS